MRIGINLIPLRPGQMGGAEVYFRDLLAELVRLGRHRYVLVTADYNHESLPADSPACRRILFARQPRGLAAPRRLMGRALGPLRRLVTGLRRRRGEGLRDLIRREAFDLWFCPFTNLEPRVCPVPAVITVFDLQHEYYPQFFDATELGHRRHFYPDSCRAADHVIAISEFTRRSVVDRYDVDPERVSAIWLAPGSDVPWGDAAPRVAEVRQRYALPPRYAIYPANTWHHKNHARLIEALAICRRQQGDVPTLVLTGVSKEGHGTLLEAIDAHGLTGLVRSLGLVPRADLPPLYAGATCLVFPSLFEGFGIPLVEAMAAGCPIAAADVGSIPEVAGDAALLFDPLDPADIARALAAIAGGPELAAALAARGRERAALFSASRMAAQTAELFERVHRESQATGRAAGRELIAAEGVYDDHWMGQEALIALRGAALASLEIEGDLAAVAPLLPQRIVARVNGHEAADLRLTRPGAFSLTVPLGRNGAAPGAWDVSLVCERTFRPRDLGPSPDGRTLGVRVLRLVARAHDGRRIVRTLGSDPAPGSAT
jgi:glycosyltransferase involved in cell wall biosynthesis